MRLHAIWFSFVVLRSNFFQQVNTERNSRSSSVQIICNDLIQFHFLLKLRNISTAYMMKGYKKNYTIPQDLQQESQLFQAVLKKVKKKIFFS